MATWLDSLRDRLGETFFKQASDEEGKGGDPADFLFRTGRLTREELLRSLSLHFNVPSVMTADYEPEDGALSLVPEDVARRFTLMPLFTIRDRIYVAVTSPGDLDVEDFIHHQTGFSMEELVALRGDIEEAINRYYLAGGRSAEKMMSMMRAEEEEKGSEKEEEVRLEAEDAPSIKLVSHIISSAIRLGTSDIHLEPYKEGVMLRYRIDGILREYPPPPLHLLKAVTSRIKILASMDISEKRLAQDGRTTFKVDGKDYDLRISIIPNLFGESIVIRILNIGGERSSLEKLGFAPALYETYLRLVSTPYGMFLVTGPTGSGKSTTLYATLEHILTPEKKIISIEDPVESQVSGVTQFQVHQHIGFTFAHTLRAVLRHDPEIVLVGEIRDIETAEIAIQAALTGHLLFSTLHTNDAPSAATRLIDMGVAGYLVMTTLIGVLAQRLVRRLCPRCKVPLEVDEPLLKVLKLPSLPEGATPFRPVGCESCEHSGYKGRVAIYELMEITSEMRRLHEKDMTSENLTDIAMKHNFMSLRQSGIEKWLAGVTSFQELVRTVVMERL
ncbi:MAG: GspE/PulE family protein [Candidatus Eremiobacteraeota bacterium]|nr:GspE/PulE family protein [Candidatus Eremiobacteraeota bacterium]